MYIEKKFELGRKGFLALSPFIIALLLVLYHNACYYTVEARCSRLIDGGYAFTTEDGEVFICDGDYIDSRRYELKINDNDTATTHDDVVVEVTLLK